MAELVGLKVKIGLKTEGGALYPEFNLLPCVIASGKNWAVYVDTEGLGWHYDRVSGHKEETPDSPFGTQWGMLIVPQQFATEAVAAFPTTCSLMTEPELETFYNTKAHAHEPDELFDLETLQGIRIKQELGLTLTAQQQKAIDPTDDTPGIRPNKRKTWTDYKSQTGTTIKAVIEP